jgi:nickel/cobalt transporter (NicO) family protein
MLSRRGILRLLALLFFSTQYSVLSTAHAHPVPRSSHDRTIVVRLAPDAKGEHALVTVAYRLEVDELTVVLEDMAPFKEDVDFASFRNKPEAFYSEFTRLYAPILARNLTAAADGKPLQFACVKRGHSLKDEEGRVLGHLRCDFVFETTFPLKPQGQHQFNFQEGNYELQEGRIDLSLLLEPPLHAIALTVPSEALKKRSAFMLAPAAEAQLRAVAATFSVGAGKDTTQAAKITVPENTPRPEEARRPAEDRALSNLFFRSEHGFWLLLCLAAGLGAVHALTPGHGKTLVAAYLVGERGTVLHAVVLGVVTTISHTGVVLLLAIGLLLVPGESRAAVQEAVQSGLSLGMGLLITCLGIWLLLRRLSGRADHFHIGGHPHHHHHGHSHSHAPADGSGVGWWGLITLGVSGGMVPCVDAVLLLGAAIVSNAFWLALPVLLAFSAGLAAVLVLVGIAVVHSKRFAESRWGEGRLIRSLPLVSAAAVTALGLWLCFDSVHPAASPARPAATAGVPHP